jgi:transposase-like protein
MDRTEKQPRTLLEAVRYFSDPDSARNHLAQVLWPCGIPVCPHCHSEGAYFIKTRNTYKCKSCRRTFSIKHGTLFEDSPIGLDKWLPAVWLITSAKNGISSCEVARSIGVTQKTAWFMLHRIRAAMQTKSFRKLDGTVEADETFIGGAARFMHKNRKDRTVKGTGGLASGKTAVMGLLERHGEVRARVVPNARAKTLQPQVRKNVKPGAELFTDAHHGYTGLSADYQHQVVDHAERYVSGRVHTNGMENFWSLLKRCIKGTYISVEPFHTFRYIDEETFRFNTRKQTDGERFNTVLGQVSGRRLDYKRLTGIEQVNS